MEKLAEGYGLVEGPIWVPGQGLLYSDVLNGGVFCVDRQGNVTAVFAYRKGIGGMSVHENGGMIVSGRNISWKSIPEGETITVLDQNEAAGLVGFNDITTDEVGRIYAGSLGSSPVFDDGREPQSGDLYLIELDGSARKVANDIQLTNGLGFSPDGKTLYHSDSSRNHINCYSVQADGTLGEKQIFATTDVGSPDGLVVSEDGRVWVALPGGSGVGVYHADGSFDQLIEIPEPMCTSVCFGGEDLKDLYIVSGSRGAGSDRAGSVYVQRVDVAGLAVPLARVSLTSS
jgi:xylono-1,5-lactonase